MIDLRKIIFGGIIGGCFAALSVHMGYNATTWEFWAIITLMIANTFNS